MKELEKLVYQALGEASMCWSQVPKGIFQSNKAVEIGEKLIKAIQALSQSEWISVEDRLPEQVGFYLVVVDNIVASKYKGNIEIGECFKSVNTNGLFEILKFHDYITHWMPLPQPPQTK